MQNAESFVFADIIGLFAVKFVVQEENIMPRKGENIYKRKDNRWEGRYITTYNVEGRAVYKSVYGKTYTEVKLKMKSQPKSESTKSINILLSA